MAMIYQLDALGQWTGQSAEVPESDGWPADWTHADSPPPALAGDQVAVWIAGGWVVAARRSVEPPSTTRRLTKIDFARLFSPAQLVAYLALKAQAKALTPADFADPSKAVVIQAAVMFEKFDLLPDIIELDHPETVAGVGQVLVAAGVLSQGEAARVLANTPPVT